MEILKKIYKKLILVSCYTLIASLVYGYWFHTLWHLWYVTLLTILGVVAIGAVIGYFYVRGDLKPVETKDNLDTPKEIEPEKLPIEEENKEIN